MKVSTLIAATVFMTAIAPALGDERIVTVLGAGAVGTCSDWKSSRDRWKTGEPFSSGSTLVYDSWLGGYLSGLNVMADTDQNVLEAVDLATIQVWMDRYCRQHQKGLIRDGADDLFIALKKLKLDKPKK